MTTCFDRVGIIAPDEQAECVCGELVDFHVAIRRARHFLVCPIVDQLIARSQAGIEIDERAVELALANLDGVI